MKKVANVFLGIIIFGALIVASVLMVGRQFLAPKNMVTLMNIVAKDEGGYEKFTDILDSDEKLGKYIDEKKLEKALSEYLSSYFKVQAGVLDKMDSDDLEEVLHEAVDKYNKTADDKIAKSEVKDAIAKLDKELKTEQVVDKDVKKVFEVIYSKTIYVCIGIIVLCLFLIYLVCKRLDKVLFHLGLTSLINGIIIKLGGGAFGRVLEEDLPDELQTMFNKNLMGTVSKIGITAIVIGVICIVASIIIKKSLDSKGTTEETPELNEMPSEPVRELPEEPTPEENTYINDNKDL
jgi:hypothetical protein